MIIIPDGSENRWRISYNYNSNEIDIYYEGLCSMVGDWVCIAQLSIDDEIYEVLREVYRDSRIYRT